MQKKLLLLPIIFVVLTFTSCVDKAFDLSDIATDNITLGSDYVVPMGEIVINLEDYLSSDLPSGSPSRTIHNYKLSDVDEEFIIDEGFDEDIIDKLTCNGTLKVIATVSNIFPVELKMTVKFINKVDGDVSILNNANIKSSSTGVTRLESEEITHEMLTKISKSKSVKVLITPKIREFSYDDTKALNITLRLSVKKSGGLKL